MARCWKWPSKINFVNRIVLPEILDGLPPEAAAAQRSRRDLRRVNAWMGHPQIMARALRNHWSGNGAARVVELGAGDGHFLLSVAGRLNGQGAGAEAILVDRLKAVTPETLAGFQRAGWRARSEIGDAGAWLRSANGRAHHVIVSNLFLHHFPPDQLGEMLRLAAGAARLVVALEPRRGWLPLLSGRLLWAIGCGQVTRHDACVSVRAGFAGREISALWPDRQNWRLTERPAGLFSHLFIARRKE